MPEHISQDMFAGIIEELGKVSGINRTLSGVLVSIKADRIYKDMKLGDSIAINGVCLTVTEIKNNILCFDAIQETIERTDIGSLRINDAVNLESSIRADSRIGGHFVSGHIDYKGRIEEVLKAAGRQGFKISLPPEFSNYVVSKGSIALDGVSLTVADVLKKSFIVYLIPHTLKVTILGNKKKGDFVNVETDILAKYTIKQAKKSDMEQVLKDYNYL